MTSRTRLVATLLVVAATLPACDRNDGAETRSVADSTATGGTLVLYSGRGESLVAPVIQLFEKETGVDVQIKYGNTPELALTLREEGAHGSADVFWAQDAGALGALTKAGMFADLPADLMTPLPAAFRHGGGHWVATSGRARVIAYSSQRVTADALPGSVFDLTDARFKERVGWAPSNASFQAFVTAMRRMHGEERTRQWLEAMKANGTRAYAKNTAIVQAIAAGEIDFGLPNHYYLLSFKKADAAFPVEQAFFAPGDVGNLVNVAGVGILATSKNRASAERFVRFLLSPAVQQYFASDIFEYPVIESVVPSANLVGSAELMTTAPSVTLDDLDDLDGTLALLRAAGLL